jgi:methionyl-tRNA formyltransferase
MIKKKIRLIAIGGNRLYELYPFKSLVELSNKYNVELFILTENVHLKKKVSFDDYDFQNFLNKLELKYFKIKNYKHLYNTIKKIGCDSQTFILLLNSIFFIKNDIISLVNQNIYNLHVGKLPEQRGAGVTTWQFMSGMNYSAVTIHKVKVLLDTGNIILQKKFSTRNLKKPIDFYKKAVVYEKTVLDKFLSRIIKNKKFKEIKQNESDSIYMPRIDTNTHSYINWLWTKNEILNFIRAFDKPFNGTRTFLGKKKCILTNAKIIKSPIKFHPYQSGIIVRESKNFCYIAVNKGILRANISFLSSQKPKSIIGKRLHTPIEFLESSLKSSASHTPNSIVIKKN